MFGEVGRSREESAGSPAEAPAHGVLWGVPLGCSVSGYRHGRQMTRKVVVIKNTSREQVITFDLKRAIEVGI